MSDYERIATIIRYMDGLGGRQPSLGELAAQAGLSASHFHRLFSAWVGVTPKVFLQCLTLARAKLLLAEGNSVLDSALNSGLSGPGRLHDLCVHLVAASPGEIKSGGAGWIIRAGYAESPFGLCLVAESPRGICHLSFEEERGWEKLAALWPAASVVRDDEKAFEWSERIFNGRGRLKEAKTLQAYVKGSDFQVRVWQALLQIPAGRLVSYGVLAGWVGDPNASRAVGTAVGNNPIGFLIPCHRVIRATGALGGYRWGPERKQAIQVWEALR